MAHRVEQEPVEGEVVLQVEPGHPGMDERTVRVSPDYVEDLRACLEAAGLRASTVIELSAGSVLAVLSVAASAALVLAGGVAAGLKEALPKFLERHKDKKIVFGETGRIESMEGFSAKDIARVVDLVDEKQREYDASWQRIISGEAGMEDGDGEDPPPPQPK